MGKTGSSKEQSNKRPRDPAEKDDGIAKKILAANKFASLADQTTEKTEKKEKMPPFYVKGFPPGLRQHFNELISKGLIATLRLCTDGYKIVVPSTPHYKAVEAYLKQTKAEYFTHDIAATKPFKVVLRGLPELELDELKTELVACGLEVEAVYKMIRHNKAIKYRDQLYLIHLTRGSTTLSTVKTITALFNIIVQWERYKPIHRDVTQCSNCLNYGHGTKNCHIKSRCMKCAGPHRTVDCLVEEAEQIKCLNCDKEHATNSRSCPKRAEFIKIRSEIANRQRPSNRKSVQPSVTPTPPATSSTLPFPPPPTGGVPSRDPPGFLSYAQAASMPPASSNLYSMEQLATLFLKLDQQTKACRTNQEQIAVMMTFYYRHGSILSNP